MEYEEDGRTYHRGRYVAMCVVEVDVVVAVGSRTVFRCSPMHSL
jgi:hypothetical protein